MKRIVLIDDDPTTNTLNKMIIERSELVDEVVMFEQAEQALFFLKGEGMNQKQSLILLDINMPLMDGWDFLDEYMKLNGTRRSEKIVLLSSSIDPVDISRAEEFEKVSEFKSKPLSVEMLTNLVTKYLN